MNQVTNFFFLTKLVFHKGERAQGIPPARSQNIGAYLISIFTIARL